MDAEMNDVAYQQLLALIAKREKDKDRYDVGMCISD
jgi:hypothetical protein